MLSRTFLAAALTFAVPVAGVAPAMAACKAPLAVTSKKRTPKSALQAKWLRKVRTRYGARFVREARAPLYACGRYNGEDLGCQFRATPCDGKGSAVRPRNKRPRGSN